MFNEELGVNCLEILYGKAKTKLLIFVMLFEKNCQIREFRQQYFIDFSVSLIENSLLLLISLNSIQAHIKTHNRARELTFSVQIQKQMHH